ncbi:MAG: tRNA (cytidine(34)-2'-O)-methyltransferase [Nakamurella sp.]
MFRIALLAPQIGPNAGNIIRTSAATGCELHLIKPLGFDMSDKHLRRAGLDYHDLATVVVHENFEEAYASWAESGPVKIYAFASEGTMPHSDIAYKAGDVLLFGSEQTGLDQTVLDDPRIWAVSRIPMLPVPRSLNLATSAAIVAYEAWRQNGYQDSGPHTPASGEFN